MKKEILYLDDKILEVKYNKVYNNPNQNKPSNDNSDNSEEKTFARAFGRFLRNGWIAISTFFDNDRTGRNLSTIMISLSN